VTRHLTSVWAPACPERRSRHGVDEHQVRRGLLDVDLDLRGPPPGLRAAPHLGPQGAPLVRLQVDVEQGLAVSDLRLPHEVSVDPEAGVAPVGHVGQDGHLDPVALRQAGVLLRHRRHDGHPGLGDLHREGDDDLRLVAGAVPRRHGQVVLPVLEGHALDDDIGRALRVVAVAGSAVDEQADLRLGVRVDDREQDRELEAWRGLVLVVHCREELVGVRSGDGDGGRRPVHPPLRLRVPLVARAVGDLDVGGAVALHRDDHVPEQVLVPAAQGRGAVDGRVATPDLQVCVEVRAGVLDAHPDAEVQRLGVRVEAGRGRAQGRAGRRVEELRHGRGPLHVDARGLRRKPLAPAGLDLGDQLGPALRPQVDHEVGLSAVHVGPRPELAADPKAGGAPVGQVGLGDHHGVGPVRQAVAVARLQDPHVGLLELHGEGDVVPRHVARAVSRQRVQAVLARLEGEVEDELAPPVRADVYSVPSVHVPEVQADLDVGVLVPDLHPDRELQAVARVAVLVVLPRQHRAALRRHDLDVGPHGVDEDAHLRALGDLAGRVADLGPQPEGPLPQLGLGEADLAVVDGRVPPALVVDQQGGGLAVLDVDGAHAHRDVRLGQPGALYHALQPDEGLRAHHGHPHGLREHGELTAGAGSQVVDALAEPHVHLHVLAGLVARRDDPVPQRHSVERSVLRRARPDLDRLARPQVAGLHLHLRVQAVLPVGVGVVIPGVESTLLGLEDRQRWPRQVDREGEPPLGVVAAAVLDPDRDEELAGHSDGHGPERPPVAAVRVLVRLHLRLGLPDHRPAVAVLDAHHRGGARLDEADAAGQVHLQALGAVVEVVRPRQHAASAQRVQRGLRGQRVHDVDVRPEGALLPDVAVRRHHYLVGHEPRVDLQQPDREAGHAPLRPGLGGRLVHPDRDVRAARAHEELDGLPLRCSRDAGFAGAQVAARRAWEGFDGEPADRRRHGDADPCVRVRRLPRRPSRLAAPRRVRHAPGAPPPRTPPAPARRAPGP